MRVAAARAPIEGASDHGTHEAIYLPDPDGNGIELAADRPREEWPGLSGADGYALGPAPLDVEELLAAAGHESTRHAAWGLRVGHVHLHVADLDAATRFYRDGLGFDVTMRMPTAVFLSAGGYHHHVAYNLWRGRGVPTARPDAVGLRNWTLVLDGEAELEALRHRLTAIDASVEDRAKATRAGLLTVASRGRREGISGHRLAKPGRELVADAANEPHRVMLPDRHDQG